MTLFDKHMPTRSRQKIEADLDEVLGEDSRPASCWPLRYLSVCSGIEAASVAWEPIGWQPVGFSEIEKSPFAVMPPASAVRRLTPTECERLQGFPDGHTLIPWRGKDTEACPDGPRYKALGNSMAVPVMAWIGQRIHSANAALSGGDRERRYDTK